MIEAGIVIRGVPGGTRSLCLVHGWGSNGAIWDSVKDRLATLGDVQIVDLPGHGRSPLGRGLSLEKAAVGIAGRLRRDTAIVGWSLGGLVALRLASLFPDRVSHLALVATNPRFTRSPDWPHGVATEVLETFATSLNEDYRGTLRRFLALQVRGAARPGTDLRDLRRALDAGGLPDPEALRQGLRVLASEDLRVELQAISVPTSVLLGERDTIVPVEVGQALEGLNARLRVETVAGAGHAPFLSRPAAFVEWIGRALG